MKSTCASRMRGKPPQRSITMFRLRSLSWRSEESVSARALTGETMILNMAHSTIDSWRAALLELDGETWSRHSRRRLLHTASKRTWSRRLPESRSDERPAGLHESTRQQPGLLSGGGKTRRLDVRRARKHPRHPGRTPAYFITLVWWDFRVGPGGHVGFLYCFREREQILDISNWSPVSA